MFRSSENKELRFVSNYFQNKKKEEIGHYGQALINSNKMILNKNSLKPGIYFSTILDSNENTLLATKI